MVNIRNTSVTIGTANTQVSPALYGNKRKVIILRNTSLLGEVISISIGSEAIAGQGVRLSPNDSFSLSMDGAYLPPVEQINAIASAVTATLSVYEEIQ